MSAARRIRLIASFALLCALFLPLSECRKDKSLTPPPFSLTQAVFPRDSAYASYTYPFQILKLDWSSAIWLLIFTWPFAILAVGLKWPRVHEFCFTHLLELTCCIGSSYFIYALAALCGDPLYGFYVAMGSDVAYACVALWAIVGDIRSHLRFSHSSVATT